MSKSSDEGLARRVLEQARRRQPRLSRRDARDLMREYGVSAATAAEVAGQCPEDGDGWTGWGEPGGRDIR